MLPPTETKTLRWFHYLIGIGTIGMLATTLYLLIAIGRLDRSRHKLFLNNAQGLGSNSIERFQLIQADTISGTVLDATQTGITGLGPLSASLIGDPAHTVAIRNARHVAATEIQGVLQDAAQPSITQLGPLSDDLTFDTGMNIIEAGRIETAGYHGLLQGVQYSLGSLGTFTDALDLNGYDLIADAITCTTLDGALSAASQLRITSLGVQTANLDANNHTLTLAYLQRTSVAPVMTVGTTASAPSSPSYALAVSPTTSEGAIASMITAADPGTGNQWTIATTGLYAMSVYVNTLPTSTMLCGWYVNADVTVAPASQAENLLFPIPFQPGDASNTAYYSHLTHLTAGTVLTCLWTENGSQWSDPSACLIQYQFTFLQ